MDLIKRRIDAIPAVAAPLDLKFGTKRRQSPTCNISAAYINGNQRCLVKVRGTLRTRAFRPPGAVVLQLDRETVDALRAIEKATQQVFWETIPFASIVDGNCARWRVKGQLATLGAPPDAAGASAECVLVVELVCAFFDAHKNKYGLQWQPKLLMYGDHQ